LQIFEGDLHLSLLEQKLWQRLSEVDVKKRMLNEGSHHQQTVLRVVSDHNRNFFVIAGRQNVVRSFWQKRVLDGQVTVDERLPWVVDVQVVASLILFYNSLIYNNRFHTL
jgi:hypothetical protein